MKNIDLGNLTSVTTTELRSTFNLSRREAIAIKPKLPELLVVLQTLGRDGLFSAVRRFQTSISSETEKEKKLKKVIQRQRERRDATLQAFCDE